MGCGNVVLKGIVLSIVLMGATMAFAADGRDEAPGANVPAARDVSVQQLVLVAKRRIYFGHQSVGKNILAGLVDILKEHPVPGFRIVETSAAAALEEPVFAHSRIGANLDPERKIKDFAAVMDGGIGGRADVAFLKMCYLDIDRNTDVPSLFEEYKRTMSELQKKYPGTAVVHFTVPLTKSRKTWVMAVKELLGKQQEQYYGDNIRRNEFNELMRREYTGSRRLFDLAQYESTYPDGRRSTFSTRGKTHYSLVPEYTKDGGHLNEFGRRIVAGQLLVFLASLV